MNNVNKEHDSQTEDENISQREEEFQNQRKKKISIVEVNELLRKRSKHQNVDHKHRRSISTDKTSSKAYSFRCGLDDSMVASVLQSSSVGDSGVRPCPSDNIGVRSMSIDFAAGERLGSLEAAAFAAILTEAADALEVLRRTVRVDHNELRRNEGLANRKVVRKKHSCAGEDERKMLYGRDAGFSPVILTVPEKLLRDRELGSNVFRKVACEFERNGSYDWLRCEVNAIVESKEKECGLEVNLKIWTDLAKRLRESQKTFQDEFETQKKKYMEEMSELAAEIDTSYCDNIDKLDYISRTEASKLEQQNLRFSIRERSLLDEIKELEKTMKIDIRVSEALQTYGKSVINHCEEEIIVWSDRYNEELERRQQETIELQEKIDEMKEFMQESRILQKERQIFIDAYVEEQEKIKSEMDYVDAVNSAATLIQAIWRGYMVRHELGPFFGLKKKIGKRPKKSKKKAKKKTRKFS
ncbi:uncharacterized protein LOC103318122 isoform X1 [Nasonia vitripennis]|uniref:Dynein regulatory complex protein 9 n=1 Tax=Nasonia vitripennis TaxID=7425 RepID=A0A7M7QPE9_NASVI|nr:uncharacterized protein LOC103318122 isoform X1 [Nasonia vitripennis]